MSALTDQTRTELAADNCEVLRARLAKYEDSDGKPLGTLAWHANRADELQRLAHERGLELAALKQPISDEPASWQFYQDGKWYCGMDDGGKHRANTEAAGYLVRDLYARPGNAVVMPEREARVIGYRPGMSEVTFHVEGGSVPAWMNIGDTVRIGERLNPSRGVPEDVRTLLADARWRIANKPQQGAAKADFDRLDKPVLARIDTMLSAAPAPAPEVEGDGMCNADNPAARCVCREEFGYRVCKPTVGPAHSAVLHNVPRELMFEAIAVLMLYTRGSASREGILINDIRALLNGGRS